MPNKSVRENTKERIAEIIDDIVTTVFNKGLEKRPLPETYLNAKKDQLLGLFLSPEEVEKIIYKVIEAHSTERIRGKTLQGEEDIRYCINSEDYENFEIDLREALSTTLKPSWTELELDKILPKKKEVTRNFIKCCPETIYNQAITDCKQALLGKGDK